MQWFVSLLDCRLYILVLKLFAVTLLEKLESMKISVIEIRTILDGRLLDLFKKTNSFLYTFSFKNISFNAIK